MEKFTSPFKNISILTVENNGNTYISEYQFILLLNGSVRVQSKDVSYLLDRNDILLLEPQKFYALSSKGENKFLSITIDNHFILSGCSQQEGLFFHWSPKDDTNYIQLKDILVQIATVEFSNDEFRNLNLISLAYQLIYRLNCFYLSRKSTEISTNDSINLGERDNEILNYINLHYASEITLTDLADHVHLTIPYLSQYFKKKFKYNFNYYVNRLRLSYAINDLIYTDKLINQIANSNGFFNMNTFNKLFKKEYGMTPSSYRKLYNKNKKTNDIKEVENTMLEIDFSMINPKTSLISKSIPNICENNLEIVEPIWYSLINLGPSIHLAKKSIIKQVEITQKEIGFKYGRIEVVLHNEFITKNPSTGQYNFKLFDQMIDSFINAKIIPYLDLSYSLRWLSAKHENVISIDMEEYLDLVKALIVHSANIFGRHHIENWVYEIGYFYDFHSKKMENVKTFLKRFECTYKLIKSMLPNAKVGGISYHLTIPITQFEEMLSYLNDRINPDFISLTIFPFKCTYDHNSNNSICTYTTDISHAYHKVASVKKLLQKYNNLHPQLYINVLGIDIRNHNYMNDTCFQSGFFVKNTIDLINEVDLLGYYQLSDSSFMFEEANYFLNGRNGLINQFDIKKPGYFALQLMKDHIGNYLIDKGQNYLLTKGNQDSYYVAICNYCYLLDYYCLNVFEDIAINDAYSIYYKEDKYFTIHLENLVKGLYIAKIFKINRESGSVLDEWERIDYWEPLTKNEFNYFNNIVCPKRSYKRFECNEGIWDLELKLQANEVVFIELSLQL